MRRRPAVQGVRLNEWSERSLLRVLRERSSIAGNGGLRVAEPIVFDLRFLNQELGAGLRGLGERGQCAQCFALSGRLSADFAEADDSSKN